MSEVLGLAALYGRGGGSFTGGGIFSVDLQPQLDSVRKQIAGSKTRLAAARAQAGKLKHAEHRFLRAAATAPLLSTQLAGPQARRPSRCPPTGSGGARKTAPTESGHRQHSARQAAGPGEQPDVHPGLPGFRRRRAGATAASSRSRCSTSGSHTYGPGQLLAASTARVSSSTCSASSASRCRTTPSLSGTTRPPCRFRETSFSRAISSSSTGSTTSGSTSEADTSSTRRIPAPTFASTASRGWYAAHYDGAKRILGAQTGGIPQAGSALTFTSSAGGTAFSSNVVYFTH